ncbi:MAG: ferredoxin reductase [Deltaproteobacteria bacterium]|nr:ferredoxin reductase [Deltaproteobacteria bacterium]
MRALRSLSLALDPDWIDFAVRHVDPTFSLTRTFARVVEIRRETADTTTLVLRPNRRFRGFVPGQHVPVRVLIGGVVHERCYSPTSEPHERTLAITVKRQPSGTVSRWVSDTAALGDVVEIGPAAGEFVLPPASTTPLLLIAGGSGITAVWSLARAALRRRADADVALLYYARRRADFAFARGIEELSARHEGFRVRFLPQSPEDGEVAAGRFSEAHLAESAPDWAERDTFLCGPAGLTKAVKRHWQSAGLVHRLRCEAFALATSAADASEDASRDTRGPTSVSFRRSVRTALSSAPTLLAVAESAGLRPPTGCRMGICRTCTCVKVSGTVRDRVTGEIDSAAGSRIRICVSEPLGPVTLDL